jgi:NADH:ubiquinone oxidoreductase subunit 3 (subunit A)
MVVQMLYDYAALLFFIALGLLIPALLLLASRLLGRRYPGNPTKNAPYESAEETASGSRDMHNEYLPYFMLFLPFEIVLVALLLWSTVAKAIDYNTGTGIIFLVVAAMIFASVGYKLVGGGAGRTSTLYQ